MSYILDALRRLEQDKEAAKTGVNPMEAILAPDRPFETKAGRNRFWWLCVGMLFLITIIIATYGITKRIILASHLNRGEDLAVAEHVPLDNHLPSSTFEIDMEKTSAQQPPVIEKQQKIAAPEKNKASLTDNQPQASSLVDYRSSSSSMVDREKVVEHTGNINRFESQKPFKKKKQHIAEDVLEEAEEVMVNIEDISPWIGEEIQISAIAWSQEEDSRFAVVNLKTVREGDYVAGLEIYEIREDGIIVKDGGEKYLVLVGKR